MSGTHQGPPFAARDVRITHLGGTTVITWPTRREWAGFIHVGLSLLLFWSLLAVAIFVLQQGVPAGYGLVGLLLGFAFALVLLVTLFARTWLSLRQLITRVKLEIDEKEVRLYEIARPFVLRETIPRQMIREVSLRHEPVRSKRGEEHRPCVVIRYGTEGNEKEESFSVDHLAPEVLHQRLHSEILER